MTFFFFGICFAAYLFHDFFELPDSLLSVSLSAHSLFLFCFCTIMTVVFSRLPSDCHVSHVLAPRRLLMRLNCRKIQLRTCRAAAGRPSKNRLIFLHFGKVYFLLRHSGFLFWNKFNPPSTTSTTTFQFHLTRDGSVPGALADVGTRVNA